MAIPIPVRKLKAVSGLCVAAYVVLQLYSLAVTPRPAASNHLATTTATTQLPPPEEEAADLAAAVDTEAAAARVAATDDTPYHMRDHEEEKEDRELMKAAARAKQGKETKIEAAMRSKVLPLRPVWHSTAPYFRYPWPWSLVRCTRACCAVSLLSAFDCGRVSCIGRMPSKVPALRHTATTPRRRSYCHNPTPSLILPQPHAVTHRHYDRTSLPLTSLAFACLGSPLLARPHAS